MIKASILNQQLRALEHEAAAPTAPSHRPVIGAAATEHEMIFMGVSEN